MKKVALLCLLFLGFAAGNAEAGGRVRVFFPFFPVPPRVDVQIRGSISTPPRRVYVERSNYDSRDSYEDHNHDRDYYYSSGYGNSRDNRRRYQSVAVDTETLKEGLGNPWHNIWGPKWFEEIAYNSYGCGRFEPGTKVEIAFDAVLSTSVRNSLRDFLTEQLREKNVTVVADGQGEFALVCAISDAGVTVKVLNGETTLNEVNEQLPNILGSAIREGEGREFTKAEWALGSVKTAIASAVARL